MGLIGHNLGVRKLRLAMASLAVAIGVMTVVTFSIVNHSLRASALAIMQTGRADFTVAQKGVSDLLNSNIDEATLQPDPRLSQIAGATGVLIGTTRLNAANPLFLEIGINPTELADFGVTVVVWPAVQRDATEPGDARLAHGAQPRQAGRGHPHDGRHALSRRRDLLDGPGARRHRRNAAARAVPGRPAAAE